MNETMEQRQESSRRGGKLRNRGEASRLDRLLATNSRTFGVAVNVCRIVLAATFIFSGFVKSVDPWGTAIKVSEYLNGFGFEGLDHYRFWFAIWLCAAELMMGLMLLFRVRLRLVSIFALLSMTLFTFITFVIAVWAPVEDCGCFGDAVKLSNWETFFKNLFLWPMSWLVWYSMRGRRIFVFSLREVVLALTFASLAGGLGVYCFCHLPLIDFLPFKVGTDLYAAVQGAEEPESVLIFRDKQSGQLVEFGAGETGCWENPALEYVDSRLEEGEAVEPSVGEFALLDGGRNNVTAKVLAGDGRIYMLCVQRPDRLGARCEAALERLVRRAAEEGARVVCLTPGDETGRGELRFGRAAPVPVYQVDSQTLITLLRARAGVVTLDDGVITDKRNCRDID